MIRLFKKLYIGYILSLVALLIIILTSFVFSLINEYDALYSLILILVEIATFILVIVDTLTALYKHNKLVSILNDKCDAVGFINAYYPLSMRNTDKKTRALVLTNLAVGYINAGNTLSARNALAEINIANVSDSGIRFSYYAAWTAIFENENDISNALRTVGFIKKIIDDNEIKNKALLMQATNSYNIHIATINVKNRQFNGVEETLTEIYRASQRMIEKVSVQYILAQLCMEQDRTNDAKYYLRYVAENGGTLAYAASAKVLLQQICK